MIRRRIRRLIGLFIAFVIVFPCFHGLFCTLTGMNLLEIHIRSTMFYPDAQFIYEGSPACGSSEVWRSYSYYWTHDSLEVVRNYYEGNLLPFASNQNEYGEWLNIGYDTNLGLLVDYLMTPLFSEENVYLYRKVWITIADLNQENLAQISALQPGWCSRIEVVDGFWEKPPSNGTLIIYAYDIWVG